MLEGESPVAVGARAFDLLVALTERAGEVVSKEELMERVWPGTFVEEGNIRVHIAGLRRALRDGQGDRRFIVNVPGRGYSFVAVVQTVGRPEPAAPRPAPEDRASNLPVRLSRIIGRTAVAEALCMHLAQRRFVTLVGPGGIGKTTVAVAVARELAPVYSDGVRFVDLSPTGSPELVPGVIAAALGLAVPVQDAIPAVVAYLRGKSMLIVLDNCEHVIEAAAIAAEQISGAGSDIHVLATSREPLRAAGERVHRLSPLESPSVSQGLTAAEALTYPGIQLFVERVAESLGGFSLTDADAPLVADICRRLDGIALALELAAGRVAAFGLRELAVRLDDRFRLLTSGRRTALPRHQTLAATLDWSFELLPPDEQSLLSRVSLFAGEFSLQAAGALLEDATTVAPQIADLVAKSLVIVERRGQSVNYRLLETTRIYGREKLQASHARPGALRAHARYVLDLYTAAEAASETMASPEWLAAYGGQIDNLRAALDWAATEHGDPSLLVSLTAAAVPLWVKLSLMGECRTRVERALPALGQDTHSLRLRMRLCAALGWALMYASGRTSEIGAAWSTTLDLAEQFDDQNYRIRALWGVWMSKLNTGDLDSALAVSQRMLDRVAGTEDATDLMLADRLMATTLHYRGDQGGARLYIERMLERFTSRTHKPRTALFHADQQVTAHYFQARITWLQGYPDDAMAIVERNVTEGMALGSALSMASVLGQGACPVALFRGDLTAARHYAELLIEHSEKHAIRLWHVWAECFLGLISVKEGNSDAGLSAMRSAFHNAGDSRLLPRYMVLLGEFAAAAAQGGHVAEGLETLVGAVERCERSGERWYIPELLRMTGELQMLAGGSGAAVRARAHFKQAIIIAHEQDARSWQLRSAISLARLPGGEDHQAKSRRSLAEIYGRFSQGFTTPDLRAAASLLAVV